MSIDALRGFDMFWIIGGNALVMSFVKLFVTPPPEWLQHQFSHVEWEGFTAWDLIMPLFLFITGASMPFSFGRRLKEGQNKTALYMKIVRRTLLLFVLGIAAQGNLFKWDLAQLHLYCNTLQSIAAGYIVAAFALLHLRIVWQFALAVGLMVVYWVLMMFVPTPGHGAAMLEPGANLALWVDETILRSFRDGTSYTWILSSLTFASSVLLGVMGGHILKSSLDANRKTLYLAGAGVACLLSGYLWSFHFPIIKHLWTSSMTLWAAGWSFLLLAMFYWVIDVAGFRRWAFPFVVIGMNAIAVYMAVQVFGDSFMVAADELTGGGGLMPARTGFHEFLRYAIRFGIIWLILLYMYRKKTFLRV